MWEDVMCHRVGAPPLRFLGARLDRGEVSTSGERLLFLMLVARRTRSKRDFVVSFSDPEAAWRANSYVTETIEAAIGVIEARCARILGDETSARTGVTSLASVAEIIEAHCRTALQERRFCELAAHSLDRWLALAAGHSEPARPANRKDRHASIPV